MGVPIEPGLRSRSGWLKRRHRRGLRQAEALEDNAVEGLLNPGAPRPAARRTRHADPERVHVESRDRVVEERGEHRRHALEHRTRCARWRERLAGANGDQRERRAGADRAFRAQVWPNPLNSGSAPRTTSSSSSENSALLTSALIARSSAQLGALGLPVMPDVYRPGRCRGPRVADLLDRLDVSEQRLNDTGSTTMHWRPPPRHPARRRRRPCQAKISFAWGRQGRTQPPAASRMFIGTPTPPARSTP